MPKFSFRPPEELVKQWPEIFDGMYMNTFPIEYLELIHLEFVDGGVWQINIKDQMVQNPQGMVSNGVLNILDEFKEKIHRVEFKVDVDKLKKDARESAASIF